MDVAAQTAGVSPGPRRDRPRLVARSPRPGLPAITGIRFFLALWVIAMHMAEADSAFKGLVNRFALSLRAIVATGPLAVGVFFLLSGFVLAYNYNLGQPWSTAQRLRFWAARLARVYPVYVLALVLGLPSLVFGTLKNGPLHPAALATGEGAVLLLVQAWIPHDALFWGGPAWSLSVEAFFYLCFPFAGRLLWKMERRGVQWLALGGLWLTACSASWAIAAWKAPWFLSSAAHADTAWSELIKFDPLIRLPEFLAGVILCKIFVTSRRTSPGRDSLRGPLLYLCGAAAALVVLAHAYDLPPAVLHDGLLLPATAAIILGLSFGGGWLARWLSRPWIVVLGQASYSMYLLHIPLYSYFAAADKRLVHSPAEAWASFLLYVVCLFAVCCVTFFKLEEPARRGILKKLYPNKPAIQHEAERAPAAAADPF
jgi:peptidoglycan/LPS O-acetylase OafA/YrhL